MALQEFITGADAFFQEIAGSLNTVVITLVILLFGFVVGKIIDRVLRRLLADLRIDDVGVRWFKARRNYARTLRHTIVRIVYLATVLLALYWLSMLRIVLWLFVAAVILVGFISAVLAGVDIIPNISGAFALRRKRIQIGDDVTIIDKSGMVSGTIVEMTLLDVHVRRHNGDVFFLPNSAVVNDRVVKRRQHPQHT
jgi:small-conductance mechanosensitive channel